MEGLGGIFVVYRVYKLATSQGDKVIKEEDFELGKKRRGGGVRFGLIINLMGFFCI